MNEHSNPFWIHRQWRQTQTEAWSLMVTHFSLGAADTVVHNCYYVRHHYTPRPVSIYSSLTHTQQHAAWSMPLFLSYLCRCRLSLPRASPSCNPSRPKDVSWLCVFYLAHCGLSRLSFLFFFFFAVMLQWNIKHTLLSSASAPSHLGFPARLPLAA